MLLSAGLDEFVQPDVESYVRAAVAWAGKTKHLGTIRAGMRERLQSAAYFDVDGVCDNLADACRHMWRQWLVEQRESASGAISA